MRWQQCRDATANALQPAGAQKCSVGADVQMQFRSGGGGAELRYKQDIKQATLVATWPLAVDNRLCLYTIIISSPPSQNDLELFLMIRRPSRPRNNPNHKGPAQGRALRDLHSSRRTGYTP